MSGIGFAAFMENSRVIPARVVAEFSLALIPLSHSTSEDAEPMVEPTSAEATSLRNRECRPSGQHLVTAPAKEFLDARPVLRDLSSLGRNSTAA